MAEPAGCPGCGATVPPAARYCPECGRPTGPRASVRAWPLDPVAVLAVCVAIGGVILLVGGVWAWGVAVLLVAAVVLLAARELRAPHGRSALADLRTRASAAREAVAVRSRGQVELFRARRELVELDAERQRRLRDLGAAVFDGDDAATTAARAAVAAVVDRIRTKEAEMQTLARSTDEQVRRVRASARPTEVLAPQEGEETAERP